MRTWGTSDVQQLASPELARAWLTDPEGGSCKPATIALEAVVPLASGGASCRPDGTGTTSAGIRVAVEVATGVAANGGQVKKVSEDALKLAALLATAAFDRGVVLLTSPALHTTVTGSRGWRRAACEVLGVEIVLVDPGSTLSDRLVAAATTQGAAFRAAE